MGEKEVVIITGCSGLIGSALINKLGGHFYLGRPGQNRRASAASRSRMRLY